MESITGDQDYLRDRDEHRPRLSSNGAMMTIIKCAIGAGSFSLPKAFMDGGVYLSFFFTLFLGVLSACTILILMNSSQIAAKLVKLQTKIAAQDSDIVAKSLCAAKYQGSELNYSRIVGNSNDPSLVTTDVAVDDDEIGLTYPEVGAIAFPEAQVSFRGMKCNAAYVIISLGILMTSLGVCAAYVDFISDTLPEVLRNFTNAKLLFLTRRNVSLLIMPIILSLSFLRTMKVLTYTSLIGNVAVFSGCVGVIMYGYFFYRHDLTFDHSFVEWKTLPKYIGGNTFLFAIHVVILPIMQQMDDTDNNKVKKIVIAGSFSFITLFNAVFGFIGFLLFANSECKHVDKSYFGPCDNILSNMSGGNVLDTIRILVCVDLLFTVPLILAASRVIIEKLIFQSDATRRLYEKWFQGQTAEVRSNVSSPGNSLTMCRRASSDSVHQFGSNISGDDEHSRSATDNESKGSNSFHDAETIYFSEASVKKVDQTSGRSSLILDSTKCMETGCFAAFVQYTVRSLLVTTVILMSISIPQFGDMVDLVGGLVMPLTCFLLPSAMNIRLINHLDQLLQAQAPVHGHSAGAGCNGIAPLIYKKRGSMPRFVFYVHLLIILFGVITMAATTALTVTSL
jgi:amino acid permease